MGTKKVTTPAPKAVKPAVKKGKKAEAAKDVFKPKSFPMYEGAQVMKIIEADVHGKWHLAQMSDGTTKHVPLELFK